MKRWNNNNRKPMIESKISQEGEDEFLESAESYYLNKFRKEQPMYQPVHRGSKVQVKDSYVSKSKITEPHQVRQSIERDRTDNLEHWRKEAFKFQDKALALER
jgi:hypothetical protein